MAAEFHGVPRIGRTSRILDRSHADALGANLNKHIDLRIQRMVDKDMDMEQGKGKGNKRAKLPQYRHPYRPLLGHRLRLDGI